MRIYDHSTTPPSLPDQSQGTRCTLLDGVSYQHTPKMAKLPDGCYWDKGTDDKPTAGDGERVVRGPRVVRDGLSVQTWEIEGEEVQIQRRLARIEEHVPTVLAALELAVDAGYTTPPVDSEDALAQGMARIGEATLDETQAGLLLKQARDTLDQQGITWTDVLWFAGYAAEHPEVLA